jgi:hypothetical protein
VTSRKVKEGRNGGAEREKRKVRWKAKREEKKVSRGK